MRPLATRWFEHDEPVILRTLTEVDAMLDAMPHAPGGNNVALVWVDEDRYDGRPAASTHSLRIGVNGQAGSLFYRDRRPGLGYPTGIWFSVGDPDAPGDVEYSGGIDAQHFHPTSSVIGPELIRRAVHEFADTGRRPTCVTWQDWRPPLVETEPTEETADNWF